MLSVILFVLRIILWILLILLGLLLAILVAVLFGAIRYRADGTFHQGKFQGKIKISWLFPLFSFSGIWNEAGQFGTARFLGIRVWTSDKETDSQEEENWDEEPMVGIQEIQNKEPENLHRAPESGPEESSEKIPQKDFQDKASDRKKDQSHWKEPFQKIRFSFNRIYDKLKSVRRRWDKVKAWICSEENQQSVKLALAQSKRAVKHLLPRKGEGSITFGLDAPYLTGVILKYAALFYPLYGERIQVFPVFDTKIFEAEGWLKGRIRIGVLISCILRLLMDKNIRGQVINWIKR